MESGWSPPTLPVYSHVMFTVGFLLFTDVEELDFVGPLEVFGMAAQFGAECTTLLIAAERGEVRCRHGMRVLPDVSFDDAPPLDLLVVPGGLGARTHARRDERILEFVRKQSGVVASVCTGALIIGAAGLLEGSTATTHHASLDALREFANVDVDEGARFVLHERVATSAGVSAGIDLSLSLVARMWGRRVAHAVAFNMEWPYPLLVRRARTADGEAILGCLREAFAPYEQTYTAGAFADTVLTAASLQERMRRMTILVADDGRGAIRGTIAYEVRTGGEGHLRGMAVRAGEQGTGVAEALLVGAEEELRRRGCRRITLDTTTVLTRAIAFYERNGYRATGHIGDFFGMPLHEFAKVLD